MITERRDSPQEDAALWRDRVNSARETDDPRQLALALTNLGLALFEIKIYDEGVQAFDEAIVLADGLDDVALQVQSLGVKAMAFQEVERFHNAYETVEQIVRIADAVQDTAIKCDALITEAQILVQSGEPVIAFEKLSYARRLALQMGDKRRHMHAAGVLGNVSVASAALGDAVAYLQVACNLAHDLQDPVEAEHLINLGTVLKWQDRYAEAIEAFKQALQVKGTHDLPFIELASLRYLTECYANLNDAEQVMAYAGRGAELAQAHHDTDTAFVLLEALALAAYRTDNTERAHDTLREMIDLARSIPDPDKEVDMLVSLGESYLSSGNLDQALDTYHQALDCARQLQRAKDEAYLVGRVGIIHAEQGRVDEALHYHMQALELARQGDLPELEAEQLCMVAMAYLEQNDIARAVNCCTQAIDRYACTQNVQGKQHAQTLMANINALRHGDDLDY